MNSSFEDSYTNQESSGVIADSFVEDSLDVNDCVDNSLVASSFSSNDGIINNSIDSPYSHTSSHKSKSSQRRNQSNNSIRETPTSTSGSKTDSGTPYSNESFTDSNQTPLRKSFSTIRTPKTVDSDEESDSDVDQSLGSPKRLSKKKLNDGENDERLVESFSKARVSGEKKEEKNKKFEKKEGNERRKSNRKSDTSRVSKSSLNSSFTQMRSPGLIIESDSDSDIDFSVKKTNIHRRKIPTIQSDSDDDVQIIPEPENKIIDVSSDESTSTNQKPISSTHNSINKSVIRQNLNQTIMKQTTLDAMVKKMPQTPKSENKPARNSDAIYCTRKELNAQSQRVSSLKADVQRVNILQSTVNRDKLPDKGENLRQRFLILQENLRKEEEKLSKMVVENEELIDTKPNVAVPWEKLQAGAADVVPRTWGKQAMATHTMQKTLTMDTLKDLHTSLDTCPSEDTLAEDPKYLSISLMPHQKRALAWLVWRESQKPSGGILADDMGLGKTLTMISLILKSNEVKSEMESESDDEKENSEKENSWSKKGKKSTLIDGGTLIICPTSLMNQWEGEVQSKCKRGALTVEIYHGTQRETKPKRLAEQDMIITTYTLARQERDKKGPLFRIKWRRIILDEAHAARNHKSQTSVAMCELHAKSRWALTGTPVHNTENDLYALLKFLRCAPFDDISIWKRWVANKNCGGQDRLNTVIKSIMLRRTKEQLKISGALQNLPEKDYKLIQLKLDKQETQVYQKVLIFSKTLFAQFLHQRAEKNTDLNYDKGIARPNFMAQNDPNGEYYKMHKKILKMHGTQEVKSHEILVLLLRLRQICCHPSLIVSMLENESYEHDGLEEDGVDVDILDKLHKLDLNEEEEHLPANEEEPENFSKAASKLLNTSNPVFDPDRSNDKIRKALEIVKERVLPNNDKVIIVSQWTSMLKVVSRHFKDAGIVCDSLDGSVPVMKRNNIVKAFNDPNHELKVLLLSLTAGGVGLNLIGGNHLILMDLHWNPQLESQAQDRIYRVGQKKSVVIYKMVTMDTIEERIKALQDHKLQMASDVLSGTKVKPGSKLSLDDLKMLFSI